MEMALRYDHTELRALEVPRTVCKSAVDSLDPTLRAAIERSVRNIASVQRAFLPTPVETSPEPGIVVGRRPDPLRAVGVYAPGGLAAYPSSVLMGAVPAKVAGVQEVVLCSPPDRSGCPSQAVLAAAELSGVDRVFAVGGAGAIAAMAYGTESVPRVDRIVGPGNAYVAEAKIQVARTVAIDSPAGPSELLVVADSSASPDVVVAEVLAQAEHDPRAVVVVVAIGESTANSVIERLISALPSQQRRDIIAQSLMDRGAVLWAADIDEAISLSNDFAPEHLLLALSDATSVLPRFRNAGTIFVGETSSVTFGDYMTGANHVLPTGGLARSYSGLSVLDFIRWTTYQAVDAEAAARLATDVGVFAMAEGLPAHAAAAQLGMLRQPDQRRPAILPAPSRATAGRP
jgi:histidinol dehydrogenase